MMENYNYRCIHCGLVIPYGGFNQDKDRALEKMLEHICRVPE